MSVVFKTLVLSGIVNILLVLVKIIFGIIGHSSAVIADGLHSLSDLITDVVGIAGNKLSNKPADKEHPYGHGKMEYITGILIGVVIFILGVSLMADVLYKNNNAPNDFILVVIIITILTKYLLSIYIVQKGKKHKNNILIASGTESKMDVLSSIVVLISFLSSKLSKYHYIFKYSDKVGGLIVSLFIVWASIPILKDNINALLDERVNDKLMLNKIKKIIKKYEQVKKIANINIIKSGHYYNAIIKICMDDNLTLIESHNIVHNIEKDILDKIEKIKHIAVNVNPYIKE